jgi:hypothetical protein
MEDALKIIENDELLKDETKRKYKNYIKKIYNLGITLNETEKIKEAILNSKPSVQSMFAGAIYKVTQDKEFTEEHLKLNENYKKNHQEQKETFRCDIKRLMRKYYKISNEDSDKLIFTLLLRYPNERVRDYYNLKWKDYDNGIIHFHDLVKSKTIKEVKLKLKPQDKRLFDEAKKDNEVYIFHKGISPDSFRKKLSIKVKEKLGIENGSSQFRRLFCVNYDDETWKAVEEIVEKARQQNHTITSVLSYYRKVKI